jgi:hypothetical protein
MKQCSIQGARALPSPGSRAWVSGWDQHDICVRHTPLLINGRDEATLTYFLNNKRVILAAGDPVPFSLCLAEILESRVQL